MASSWYPLSVEKILEGSIDIDTDDIRAMLVKNGYTYSNAHEFLDDISTSYECDATNASRKSLTITASSSGDDASVSAGTSTTWSSLGGATNNTLSGVVVYKYNASDGSAEAIWWGEASANKTTDGSDFKVTWPTTWKFAT